MTIRRNINMAELTAVYGDFRFGIENLPPGAATEAQKLGEVVDTIMGDLFTAAKLSDLKVNGDDQCFETEAMLFDLMRRSNPELGNEIASVVGLGAALNGASIARSAQIIAGIERDRDFLASLQELSNEFVPGVDDRYEDEMPV